MLEIQEISSKKELATWANSLAVFQYLKLWLSRILDFKNYRILNTRRVQVVKMHNRAKFHGSRSNHYRDIAIFRFSRWQTSAILDFKTSKFNGRQNGGSQNTSSWQISRRSVKLLQRYAYLSFFQYGGRPPHWICFLNSKFSRSSALRWLAR